MDKTQFYVVFALIFIVGLLGGGLVGYLIGRTSDGNLTVTSFKECANAGYPITESYPRQCKTPDNKTFIEPTDMPQPSCVGSDCGSPMPRGAFNPVTSCQQDRDCQLVNRTLGVACCWDGACQAPHYGDSNWIAVTSSWYQGEQVKSCPTARECGAAPLCQSSIAPVGNYQARCVNNVCQKVSASN